MAKLDEEQAEIKSKLKKRTMYFSIEIKAYFFPIILLSVKQINFFKLTILFIKKNDSIKL